MLNNPNGSPELRFELFTWGIVLIATAVLYVLFRNTLPELMLFIPGLVLLGSAIYQDMQMNWRVSWFTYLLAILVVATGLGGIVNRLLGSLFGLPPHLWLIIALVELGAVLISKALYDPNPKP
jgi:uncharacterized membrane protein required for colicin V production